MLINIRTLTGRNIEIECEPTDTVGDIKEMIFKMHNYLPWWFLLITQGKILIDFEYICNCRTNDQSLIYLVFNYYDYRELTIVFESKLNIKDVKMKVFIYDFIEDVKYLIQDKTGISFESIRLYLKEYELIDSYVILETGINMNCSINAVIEE